MLTKLINFKKEKCFEELFLQLIDNEILNEVTFTTLLKKVAKVTYGTEGN